LIAEREIFGGRFWGSRRDRVFLILESFLKAIDALE
jgi:hypothetical protein